MALDKICIYILYWTRPALFYFTPPLVMTDAKGLTVWVSETYEAHTGYTLADLRGRTPGSVLQRADASPQARVIMADALRNGGSCHGVELINYRKDGIAVMVTLSIEPVRVDGMLTGFVSVQSQRPAALPEREHRGARAGRWHYTLAGGTAAWSPEVYAIFRRSPKLGPDSPGQRGVRFSATSETLWTEAIVKSERLAQGYQLELEVLRDDGTRGWVRYWGEPELNVAGEVLAHSGGVLDISDIVAMRLASAAAHGRMTALFEGALNSVLFADDEGRYVEVNPAACALLGYSRSEFLSLSTEDLVIPTQGLAPQAVWRRMMNEQRRTGRVTLKRKDGRAIVVEYAAVANVQPGLNLSVLSDVTAQVRAEVDLLAAQQQLRELVLRQQEDFDELRAELARDVHDHLGQILGALKLEIDMVTQAAPAMVPMLALHMRSLVQEGVSSVRDISRALRPSILELGLIPALRAMAEDLSKRSDVDIVARLPERLAPLNPQVARTLFRIAQEALTNASVHANAHHITVILTCHEDLLALSVCDDGCGFDPDCAYPSRGLGVLGMRERARKLGANLGVESQPGRGTIIRLDCRISMDGGVA